MPLEILVPVVVAGVAIAVILVRLLVNAPERLLKNDEMAWQVFQADYPSCKRGRWMDISRDNKAAIFQILEPAHQLGLVTVIGSKHLTRILSATDIKSIKIRDEKMIEIALADFTLPSVALDFDSAKAAQNALNHIKSVRGFEVFQ